MKSPTAKDIILILVILAGCPIFSYGQVYQNPLEWMATAEGNDAINKKVGSQIEGQTQTAVLQNTIAAEFMKIRQWEKKYSDYLQTASEYGSALKAASCIYDDALMIFITLGKLKNAVEENPEGIVATIPMNTLYLETATELVTTLTLINNAVDKGRRENMLNGAERSEIMWAINDKLAAFNDKLHRLYLSISYYSMLDVWHDLTAGMIEQNNGAIAGQAYERWKRAARAAR